jgi:hypothetical protein
MSEKEKKKRIRRRRFVSGLDCVTLESLSVGRSSSSSSALSTQQSRYCTGLSRRVPFKKKRQNGKRINEKREDEKRRRCCAACPPDTQ